VAIVEVSHLHRRYGATVAVEDVSFSVAEGEIFGLLGPNGAGKTTTVESIAGLRVPDAGTIRVLGLDPLADHAALRERVGVQLQESAQPPKLRAGEALLLYASFYRHPDDPEHLMETLGLSDKRETFFRDLSGGQKQRLSIALALIGRPTIAVLDELTTGLDPQARRDTWDLVKAVRDRGVTTLLVTHDMEEAQHLCDKVALVDAGRIVAIDTPARLAEPAAGGKVVRFRPSAAFDESLLTALPEVSSLEHDRGLVVVTGEGDLANAVILTLGKVGVSAHDLAMESGRARMRSSRSRAAASVRPTRRPRRRKASSHGTASTEHFAGGGRRSGDAGRVARHRRGPPSGGSSRTSGASPFATRSPWSGAWGFRSCSWRSSGACRPRPSRTPRSGGSASSRSTCPP
jgi:ABC-2 type transport system ATP-binding protein